MEHLIERANYMKGNPGPILHNKIMSTVFYEPSTRTLCSFQSAMLRLGGSVINVDVSRSSVQKGESIEDTIRAMEIYSDVIILRSPHAVVSPKVINAGDGTNEHPTQALLDVYTIHTELGLGPLTITLVGDLKHGRTVHSLVKLLDKYPVTFIYVSPKGLEMPSDVMSRVTREQRILSLEEAVRITDVLYVTRVQTERFDYAYEPFCVNAELMKLAKRKMIIMHPLPRSSELSPDLDSDPRSVYFKQMENGLYMRMAILESFFEKKDLQANVPEPLLANPEFYLGTTV